MPVTPLSHGAVPIMPTAPPLTHPLRPIQSTPYTFPMPSTSLQVNTPAVPPAAPLIEPLAVALEVPKEIGHKRNEITGVVEEVENLFMGLDSDGEIPVSRIIDEARLTTDVPQMFSKDDGSWTVIRLGEVATQKRDTGPWWNIFGSRISWTDTYGILLDNQCAKPLHSASLADTYQSCSSREKRPRRGGPSSVM